VLLRGIEIKKAQEVPGSAYLTYLQAVQVSPPLPALFRQTFTALKFDI
jgi:hypothetical protein